MAQCNIDTLASRASCFACVPPGYFLPLRLAVWAGILTARGGTLPTMDELTARASCFACLSPGEIAMARLQLLCNMMGGNVAYLDSIDVDPTAVSGAASHVGRSGDIEEVVTLRLLATATAGNNRLDWPDLASFQSTISAWGVKKLYLQRSTLNNNMPNPPLNLWITSSTLPPVDAQWTTIASWADASIAPLFYNDAVPQSSFYWYRLVLIVKKTGTAAPFLELDWKVATIVQQYVLRSERLVNGQGNPFTRLTWSPPWPVISQAIWCPSGCDRCVPGAHYAIYYTAPATDNRTLLPYNVFKSYDGVNFTNVTTIPQGQASPWCDEDSSHSIWYYFQAHYSNGDLVNSNTIHATY